MSREALKLMVNRFNPRYCTYLTVYSGNKLPPFYIGHSTLIKVRSGYKGSVRSKRFKRIWESELRSNPQLFTTKVISIHGTREEAIEKELFFQRRLDVLNNPLYVNRAIGRLVNNKGRKHTPEHIANYLASRKDWTPWNKGKPSPELSERNKLRRGVKNPAHSLRMRGKSNPKLSVALKQKYEEGWSPRLGKPNATFVKFNKVEEVCPYCLRTVRGGGGRRWHFDNCKEKREAV